MVYIVSYQVDFADKEIMFLGDLVTSKYETMTQYRFIVGPPSATPPIINPAIGERLVCASWYNLPPQEIKMAPHFIRNLYLVPCHWPHMLRLKSSLLRRPAYNLVSCHAGKLSMLWPNRQAMTNEECLVANRDWWPPVSWPWTWWIAHTLWC